MRFVFITLALLMVFPLQAKDAHAQSSLEDVFKKTLDDLLSKDSKPERRANRDKFKVPDNLGEVTLSYAPIVKKAAPSVVNVYAERKVQAQQRRSPFDGDPFFERFFGRNNPQGLAPKSRVQSSLGSGVIISEDGVILTNNHVIEGADDVKIVLSDGSEYECEIVLKDEKSDLAVLKIKEKGIFQAIEISDSDSVEVGDLVLAIGNPFGVGQTVTSGIVSAVARSRVGINDFDFFIQTDAAINPGNSGGALVDMKGRLIGINTAIYSRSGGSIGIGFAIPANMAQVVIRSALSGATSVARPWIGADFQEVTAAIAESLGMKRPGGVLVASVFPKGPADRAGLRPGDVVIGINKNILQNNDALGYRLDTIGIGGDAELVVISNRARKVINLKLEAAPESTDRDETLVDSQAVLGGATIANLSPAVAQQAGISANRQGVVVLSVAERSRAAANGVRKGDVIKIINSVEVATVAEVLAITAKESRRGWQVVLGRDNRDIIFERNGSFFRQFVR